MSVDFEWVRLEGRRHSWTCDFSTDSGRKLYLDVHWDLNKNHRRVACWSIFKGDDLLISARGFPTLKSAKEHIETYVRHFYPRLFKKRP